jgi:hypothetical protein
MKTNAWGWLTAAVLAAGLNASYHDGGMVWAHRIADGIEHNTGAVLALATGRADQFVSEARLLTARNERSSCPLTAAVARVRAMNARAVNTWSGDSQAENSWSPESWSGVWSSGDFDRFQAWSDREQAKADRIQAKTARLQAKLVQMRVPVVRVNPVVVRVPNVEVCPRIRVNVPEIPQVKMPKMPVVHVQVYGTGPV